MTLVTLIPTSHAGQLSLLSSAKREMSTGQRACNGSAVQGAGGKVTVASYWRGAIDYELIFIYGLVV